MNVNGGGGGRGGERGDYCNLRLLPGFFSQLLCKKSACMAWTTVFEEKHFPVSSWSIFQLVIKPANSYTVRLLSVPVLSFMFVLSAVCIVSYPEPVSCAWYYFIVNDLIVFLAHAVNVYQDTSVNVVHNLKMFLLQTNKKVCQSKSVLTLPGAIVDIDRT